MFIWVHNQKGYIRVRTKKLTKYCYRKHLLLQPNTMPCSFNVFNVFAKWQRLKERPEPAVLAAAGSPLGHIFPICTGRSRWKRSPSLRGSVNRFYERLRAASLHFVFRSLYENTTVDNEAVVCII